jgi:hypothetical protein
VNRAPLLGAIVASAVLLAVRLYAAQRLGFGDAEALYASYAWHAQPVYLDHPGLIGLVARIIGNGSPPSPLAAHRLTAFVATAVPWLAALTARAAGASPVGAATAALGLMLAPEISVGLFGLTPDLLLIVLWYASVGASLWAIQAPAGSTRALGGALASGIAAGLACDAKISGVLLLAGLVWAWASPQARAHRRTIAPYAGLAIALMVFSPVAGDEVARHFPMLRHRIVDTQRDAGLSLRNVGALAGGQLVYVTPPLLFAAFLVAQDLHRRRNDDVASRLLWSITVTALPLVLLCLVSRVAEPHWVAPLYLALPLHFARASSDPTGGRAGSSHGATRLLGPRLNTACVATGAFAVAVAHAWVLFPIGPRLLGTSYEARYDLANDLYAWAVGLPVVRQALVESALTDRPAAMVVGPHWTVCAQLHAALPADVLVGCEAETSDDFARWLPPSVWRRAPVLLYVTDDRFSGRAESLRDHRVDATWHTDVRRGDVRVRRITVTRLVASDVARSGVHPLRGVDDTLDR